MRMKWMAAATAVLVVAGGFTAGADWYWPVASGQEASYGGAARQRDTAAFTAEVVRLVNVERQRAGLSPLSPAADLTQLAAVRAEEISRVYSHTRPDGRSPMEALDPHHRHYTGENIAAGYDSPEKVVDGWMHSPGHRANILSRHFREIGVGYYHSASGPYGDYWVQVFRG